MERMKKLGIDLPDSESLKIMPKKPKDIPRPIPVQSATPAQARNFAAMKSPDPKAN